MKKNMIKWVLVFTLVIYGFQPYFVNKKVYALNVGDFSSDWKTVYPLNTNFDFLTDQQTGSGSVSQDIVGNETFHSFYVNYDEAANEIGYRIRINNADGNSKNEFTNFAFVGVDATNDGGIDFFLGTYRPTHSQGVIGIYNSDPNKTNVSPSTTGIINPALKGFTPVANVNYSLLKADSSFSGDPDYFITFRIPINDLNLALKNAGRNIVISKSSPLRYIIGTAAQDNSFNQDIGGIEGLNSKETRTWEELGVFSPAVTIGGEILNRGPQAVDDAVSVNEDESVTVNVTANDTDPDGDSIKIDTYTQGAHGSVSLVDGKLVYTPALDYSGEDTFTYTVIDGKGGVDTATVTVTIAPVNDVPITSSTGTAVTANYNEPVGGKIVATDAEGDTLQYSLVSGSSNGKVTVDPLTGDWTYTPNKGFSGVDEFQVEVSDGKGNSTTVTVQVTINPSNNIAPDAVDDGVTIKEDESMTVDVTANDTDADGDSITIDSFTQGSHGTVSLVDGKLVYTPVSNYYGGDTFTYTISDGNGGVDTATVTVTIVSLNDVPVAGDDKVTVKEDESVTIDVIVNDTDVDGDSLMIETYTPGVHGTVNLVDGKLVYTPLPNYYGEDIFTYTVSDGKGGVDSATVAVTVAAVNDAPTTVDDAVSVKEDKSVTVDVTVNDRDVDGDTITIDTYTQGAHGTVSLVDGKLVYTPVLDYHGEDTFTYTVSDGKGGVGTATVTVTIASVNDVPSTSATDTAVTTNFNETVDGKIVATDADGDALQYSLVSGTSNGTVTINTMTGDWTYTPDKGFSGDVEFRVEVSDGQGGSTTLTIQVTVNPLNNIAPDAVDDVVTVKEDESATVNVVENDTDADGDSITIDSFTQSSHGTVSLVKGKLVYTPALNYHGEDTFTYTISDGNGGVDTATVTVTIVSVNDVPGAVDDKGTVKEDESVIIDVIVNDTDVDGDPLTIETYTPGVHGTVSLVDGKLVYTPLPNYYGEDIFAYTVGDGKGGVGTATVTVTVTAVNDAPITVDDAVSVKEDKSVTVDVTVNDTDVDGDTITIDTYTQGAHGTVSLIDGKLVYTPALNYFGEDTFTYTVSDGKGGVDTAAVTVTISSINDVPSTSATGTAVTTNFNEAVSGKIVATDADGDALQYSLVSGTSNGNVTVDPVTGDWTYTPDKGFSGDDEFQVEVSDGKGSSTTVTIKVTVNPSNNSAPDAVDDMVTVKEDESVAVNVVENDTDADGDSITIDSFTQSSHGTVSLVKGKLVYTPELHYHGEDTFTYTISDGNGGVDTATVTITVAAVNDAPSAVNDAVSVKEDESVTIDVTVNDMDVDGDSITLDTYTQGAHGTVSLVDGKLVYTPVKNYHGGDTFTYTVSDGKGGVGSATVAVTVASVNDAPSAVNDAVSVKEDESVTVEVTVNDTDVDGDSITIDTYTQGAHGTVSLLEGKLVYTPVSNYYGEDTFTYTISDGKGGVGTATVTVTVASVNDAPSAVNNAVSVKEDESVTGDVTVNDTDVDGDTLTIDTYTQGVHGTVSLVEGKLVYTPVLNYHGEDTFMYTVSDGKGGVGSATVAVTVTSVNDAPAAVDDVVSVKEDESVTVEVTVNDTDVDGDSITIDTYSQGAHGTVSLVEGKLVYTPALNYSGEDTFTYTVSDGKGGVDTATVTVTIMSVNDAPIAVDDAVSVKEDESVTVEVAANDTDVDGDSITIDTYTQGAHGTVSLVEGKLVYTPVLNYSGEDSFTYTVSDGKGGVDTAKVNVQVIVKPLNNKVDNNDTTSKEKPSVISDKETLKTVEGKQLPNTATNSFNILLLGISLLLFGSIIFIIGRRRNVDSRIRLQ